ncbi:hypothetical protein DN748_12430 [Sinomicrobium soli]|nr:hypothetical protein DN748_12430 [Sinomicrobium sp. N-1-3-6]
MKAFWSHIALAMGGEKDKIWVQKRVLQQIIITQDEFIVRFAICGRPIRLQEDNITHILWIPFWRKYRN